MRYLLAVAALVFLTSGCASYTWYRPGVTPEVAAQDEAACIDLARGAARDITLRSGFYGPLRAWPSAGWTGWGGTWGPWTDPLWEADVEQRIHERCMRSRGYELRREPSA